MNSWTCSYHGSTVLAPGSMPHPAQVSDAQERPQIWPNLREHEFEGPLLINEALLKSSGEVVSGQPRSTDCR